MESREKQSAFDVVYPIEWSFLAQIPNIWAGKMRKSKMADRKLKMEMNC